jgi:TPR repeat protein
MGNGKMIFKKMHSVVAHWLVMAAATMFVSISHAQTTAQDPIEVGAAALARGHSATAYRAWIDLARAGNAQAQNNIGYLHEHGLGLSQSYQSAMEWYRKAADKNLPQAQYNIGTLYYYGYGVERNAREAVRWFRQAAKQDLAEGLYMLGVAYFEGQGTLASAPTAIDLFLKAAKKGHAGAQLMAANVYLNGDLGDVDAFAAYVWADVASMSGNPDASLVRDYASYKISRAEIAKAGEQAKQCMATGFKRCL